MSQKTTPVEMPNVDDIAIHIRNCDEEIQVDTLPRLTIIVGDDSRSVTQRLAEYEYALTDKTTNGTTPEKIGSVPALEMRLGSGGLFGGAIQCIVPDIREIVGSTSGNATRWNIILEQICGFEDGSLFVFGVPGGISAPSAFNDIVGRIVKVVPDLRLEVIDVPRYAGKALELVAAAADFGCSISESGARKVLALVDGDVGKAEQLLMIYGEAAPTLSRNDAGDALSNDSNASVLQIRSALLGSNPLTLSHLLPETQSDTRCLDAAALRIFMMQVRVALLPLLIQGEIVAGRRSGDALIKFEETRVPGYWRSGRTKRMQAVGAAENIKRAYAKSHLGIDEIRRRYLYANQVIEGLYKGRQYTSAEILGNIYCSAK